MRLRWWDELVGKAVAKIGGLWIRFAYDEESRDGRWEPERSCRRNFVRRGGDAVER